MVLNTKTKKILLNLPNFMEHSGNNEDFITSFDEDYQAVSDNIDNLKSSIQLSTATGSDLDDIGELFKLNRIPGESDSSFRGKIKTFFSNEFRGGTISAIKNKLVRALNLNIADITITEVSNLILSVEIAITEESEDAVINQISTTVNAAKPAGVYVKDIEFTSQNDIFRCNLSSSNGTDTLL